MSTRNWWWENYEPKPIDWQQAGRLAWCVLNCARIMKGLPPVPLPQAPPAAAPKVEVALTPAEAAKLLGVTIDASPDAVRAALRARMSAGGVHPDHGGDAEIAKQLIAAKNLLIEHARRKS